MVLIFIIINLTLFNKSANLYPLILVNEDKPVTLIEFIFKLRLGTYVVSFYKIRFPSNFDVN